MEKRQITECIVEILTNADEKATAFIHTKRQIFLKANKYMTRIALAALINGDKPVWLQKRAFQHTELESGCWARVILEQEQQRGKWIMGESGFCVSEEVMVPNGYSFK